MKTIIKNFIEDNIEMLDRSDYAGFLFSAAHNAFDYQLYKFVHELYTSILVEALEVSDSLIRVSKSNNEKFCQELEQLLKDRNHPEIEIIAAWEMKDEHYYDAICITRENNTIGSHICAFNLRQDVPSPTLAHIAALNKFIKQIINECGY